MRKVDAMPEGISLAQQRYVESISELGADTGYVRTSDLAEHLDVSLPSVSEAVKRLVRLGFAVRKSRSEIGLTGEGRIIAAQLERRQAALERFMVDVMLMKPARASEMACRIEHFVDREFANRLLCLAEFLGNKSPETLKEIADHLRRKVGTE